MRQQATTQYVTLLTALAVGVFAFTGCNASQSEGETGAHGHGHEHGHDHAGRPDSLREAVERLEGIEQAVGAAITSGDADAADEPLHEVAQLLLAVPDIAAETDLPKEEWEAVKAASDRLFAAYEVIHDEFHGGDGDKKAAYEKVASELTEALEEIRSRLPLAGEEPAADAPEEGQALDELGQQDDAEEPSTPDEGGNDS